MSTIWMMIKGMRAEGLGSAACCLKNGAFMLPAQ